MKDSIRIGLGTFIVLPFFIAGILVVVVLVCLKHIFMPRSGIGGLTEKMHFLNAFFGLSRNRGF